VCFSVLVNDAPSGFFSNSHGQRHEDPLSSMLFAIVMEAISKMITTSVDGGILSTFSLGSRNTALY
jgi:hypothetical protein